MKKFRIIFSIGFIVIIILTVILIFVSNNSKENNVPPTWETKTTDYIIGTASVGTVQKTVNGNGRTEVNPDKFENYIFTNKDEKDLVVEIGDIVEVGSPFFLDEPLVNKFLGRIENILILEDSIKVVVSNFEFLICRISVPQENACDVKLSQAAQVKFNNTVFDGIVCDKGYILNDEGFLEVVVEIDQNNTIFVNSYVEINIIVRQKPNVLLIPSEALIQKQDQYYVDVLDNEKSINRKEIEVGIIASDYTEVINGLSVGEIVIINQYE